MNSPRYVHLRLHSEYSVTDGIVRIGDAVKRAAGDARGFVSYGRINDAGLAFREQIEDTTNELCEKAWRQLGEQLTLEFVQLIEPIGHKFLARIDATAGENWMPAARDSRRT